jgi:hypothetical protein
MKHIKMGLLPTLTALVMMAVIVAPASAALPELRNKEGKELVKKSFSGKVGKVTFESVAGRGSTCSEGKISGKVTGLKTEEATATLTGCKDGGEKCKTEGAKEGEVTLPLTGTLVYVNKATHLMAWLYDLPSVGRLIDCFIICFKFRLSLLVIVSPENALHRTFTLNAKQTKGVQSPDEEENEKGEKIKVSLEVEGLNEKTKEVEFGKEQAGLEGSLEQEFEEEAEFKG